MDYVTVPDVELLAVGMDWPGSGGNNLDGSHAITLEHLVDAMVAANNDPLIRAPRVKLGHSRLQPTEAGFTSLGDHDPFWDGEPCFGTARDLRLNDGCSRLVGDLVEVPAWLADAIPSMWPNRSCEWVWDLDTNDAPAEVRIVLDPDVETEGGKRYSLVLTAVALLGTRQHAVKNLADVRRLLEQGPDDS